MGCCCGSDRVEETSRSQEVTDPRPLLVSESCSEDEANEIASVELLEGDAIVDADVRQWVGFSRDPKWLEDTGISHVDRLSRQVRVRVAFTRAGVERFTLQMVGAGTNVAYSVQEQQRNPAYVTTPADTSVASQHQTEGTGVAIIATFRVPAAGGHEYHFVAKDEHGNEVRSHTLTTWRMIFLQHLTMVGATPPDDIELTRTEYRKHCIELVDLAPREMAACSVDIERLETLRNTARVAYGASGCDDRKPHVIAVVSALHAAEPSTMPYERSDVDVGPDQPDLTIDLGMQKLWYDMGDDRPWFLDATLFVDPPRRAAIEVRKTTIFDLQNDMDDTTEAYELLEQELDDLDLELEGLSSVEIDIPEDHCTALQANLHPREHQMRRVRIRVSDLTDVVTRGRLVLNVQTIGHWRGGASLPNGNIVCIATQSGWEQKDPESQKQVLIHELGHKIGMVPNGANCDLDSPPNLYENRGHAGPHCHAGVALQPSFLEVRAGMTCVMWGSTSGPTTFCDDCGACVKRRDLSAGFQDF